MTGDIADETANDKDKKNILCRPILSDKYPKNGFPITSPTDDIDKMNDFQ